MKLVRRNVVSCLVVVSLFLAAGCSDEADEGTPPAPTGAQAEAQVQAVSVNIEKPVPEVQAEAQSMSVESLKAAALKYKEAILAKQADLEKLAAKVKEIPIAEALGEEAKTLKTDFQNLETSLKALKDRFQVYYNTLKEKGGDVSGLTL